MAETIAGGADSRRPTPGRYLKGTSPRTNDVVADSSPAVTRQRMATAGEDDARRKSTDDAKVGRRSSQYAKAHAKRRGRRG